MMKSLGLIRKAEMTKNKDVVFLARKSSLPGSTLAKILEGKYDTWYEYYDAILEIIYSQKTNNLFAENEYFIRTFVCMSAS